MNCFWQDLDTEVASRVVKATAAAAQAISCCDGARLHAIQVVAAGNDAVAGEAAVGCASASSAALEVAALCEAVAGEADANYLAAATLAAQQARAAASRCDVEGGAAAATQAANACADSCGAACADVAALSLAAREAAARCVVARDDLATARCVALKTATWRDLLTPVGYRYREFAGVHKEARKDAAAAALAARRATLRCVAARRHAVLAASIARKAAYRCEVAGVDGVVAAVKAREAADRCVAAPAGEAAGGAHVSEAMPPANEAEAGAVVADANVAARPDPVVPLADAAALEARKAAASCDAALANPTTDKEFVHKMRGWLMTVATLFVSIAFQGITQPPPGMSFDQCGIFSTTADEDATSPALAPAPSLVNRYDDAACAYLALNTITMAIAMTLLLALMVMPKKLV